MSKAKYHVPQPGEEIEFEDPSGFRYAITVAKWDSKHGIITTDDKRRVYVQNRSSIKLVEPSPSTAPKDDKPTSPATRRPTVGDWVEVIEVDEDDIVKVGDIVKIIHDDHDGVPYHTMYNNGVCLRESQVKLTDKRPTDAPTPAVDAPEPRPRTEEHLFREPVAVSTEFTARLPTSFASEVERAKAIADAEAEEKKRRSAAIDELKRQSDEIRVLLNKQHDALVVEDDAREDYQSRVNYLRSLRVRGE